MTGRLIPLAQRLRRDATSAEKTPWRELRGRQIEGFRLRRQAPVAGYIADFVCHDARLIIEPDGATHSTDAERAYDARRQATLETAGYAVLRFHNIDVYDQLHSIIDAIVARPRTLRPRLAMDDDSSTAHPNSPPPAGVD